MFKFVDICTNFCGTKVKLLLTAVLSKLDDWFHFVIFDSYNIAAMKRRVELFIVYFQGLGTVDISLEQPLRIVKPGVERKSPV